MKKPIEIYRNLLLQNSPLIFDAIHEIPRKLERLRREGKEIPDDLLPGRAIMKLSKEDREILMNLTSDEVSKEINPFTYYKNDKN